MEIPILGPDGTVRIVLWNSANIYAEDGTTVIATIAQGQDVTERKRAEKAIRQSGEKFKAITGSAKDAIIMMDNEGNISYWNEAAEKIFGYSAHEALGKELHLFLAPRKYHDAYKRGIFTFNKTGHGPAVGKTLELETIRKDGTIFPIELSVSAVKIEEKWHATGIVRDISQRKRAEEALRKSEEQIQIIVNNLPYAIFQIDKDLKILWANKMAREMNPDAVGQPCYKAYACRDIPCETCNSLAAISTGQIVTCTMHHPKLEGIQGESYWEKTAVPLRNGQGEVIGVIEISSNITERKLMEEERKILEVQLQEARKMEAIATLAGGIAHEFNNALVGVSGNIELLQMDLPNGENIDKYIERTKDSTRRMVSLTNQLLAYARGGKYQPKIMFLNDIVEDTVPLIQHDIDSAIRVETELPGDISHVEADLTQIQMVLSAVLNNAAEAIEGEGRIRIITRDEKIYKEFIETRPYLKPGHYVCLTIEDEGKGMDEEARSRVFEPFFTTKFQGRGLGMAAVYGIIKNHGGSIMVDSELGKGTAVRIYLPAVEVRVEQAKKAKIEMAATTGTILVIEDEDVVIDVIGPMLERLGYSMLVAKTGKEAVDVAKTFDGDIDLVILDVVLPDIRGKDVFSLIIEARPSLKVIVCSGYAVEGPAQEILDAGAQDFIQKPFSFETLSEKLKEVLRGQIHH